MSWILGISADNPLSEPTISKLQSVHPHALHVVHAPGLYIAFGGIPETCIYGPPASRPGVDDSGWVVVGSGIRREEGGCTLVAVKEWNTILSAPCPDLQGLDGHFAIVRWRRDGLDLYTDHLGLRSLFLFEFKGGLAFSTRPDWLARMHPHTEINFSSFGSQWLTFHRLSEEFILNGIEHLGAGVVATRATGRLSIRRQAWHPASGPGETGGMMEVLGSFLNPVLGAGETLSLGLSGGLDSRVLLGSIIGRGSPNCSVHTFGPQADLDVRIAHRLAAGMKIPMLHYHDPLPDAETCIALSRDYAAQLSVTEPASSAMHMRYFPRLRCLGKIVIDGGFGELARRQYFNRLRTLGSRAVRSASPAKISSYLRVNRSDIFSPDVCRIMEAGLRRQIAQRWEEMA